MRQVQCQLRVANYSAAVGSKEHIDELVKGKKVVLFMKGSPDAPGCGFSNAVAQILGIHGVVNSGDFEFHDVLLSEEIRQGEYHSKLILNADDIQI